ncbi:MAG: hypothetical protein U0939_26895 [Pirellulales bacterium]
MVDPSRHANDRNLIESILRYIPGFRGYLEQEYRRESDYLLRTWLADRLQASKKGLDEYLQTLVAALKLDDLPAFERVRAKLDGLIGKIRSAERGYSALFAFVRVREDELDRVYLLDKGLVDDVEAVAAALEKLAGAETSPAAAATALARQIDELDKLFGQRSELLRGLD